MTDKLADWDRPHFQSGGGDAELLFVVYGDIDTSRPVSGAEYRTTGLADGLRFESYDRKAESDGFQAFFDPPIWKLATADRPDLGQRVKRQRNCVTLRGTVADPNNLNYLRNAIGLLAWAVDGGGIAVFDVQQFRLWDAAEWRARVFEADEAQPFAHVATLASGEPEGTLWLHTRGLRTFGRPDLSVHGVGDRHREAAVDLIARFTERQALGGVIAAGEEVRIKSLPPGGVCRPGGALNDPDFNNVHVEIVWPTPGLSG